MGSFLVDTESLFVSVITVGEIRLGIEDLPVGKRRTALEQWVEQGLPAWFEQNLLPVTKAIADRWGRLTIQATPFRQAFVQRLLRRKYRIQLCWRRASAASPPFMIYFVERAKRRVGAWCCAEHTA